MSEITEKIKIAIQNGNAIEIDYQKFDGTITHRILSELEYSKEMNSDSYIEAYCHLRNERRIFKISRIYNLKILDFNNGKIVKQKEVKPSFDYSKSIFKYGD